MVFLDTVPLIPEYSTLDPQSSFQTYHHLHGLTPAS